MKFRGRRNTLENVGMNLVYRVLGAKAAYINPPRRKHILSGRLTEMEKLRAVGVYGTYLSNEKRRERYGWPCLEGRSEMKFSQALLDSLLW